MAPDGGISESLLQNNDVYPLIHERIQRILMQSGSVSQDTLVDQLIEDEDDDLMSDTRDAIFQKAISKFSCLIRQVKGMQVDLSKIEMKQRKGDNKLKSYAKDVVHIFLWYVELVSDFPKDVLKGEMTYIDAVMPSKHEKHPVQFPPQMLTQPTIDDAFGNANSIQSSKALSDKNDGCVDANFNGAQNPCRCPQYADLLDKLNKALADSETKQREVTNLRSHLLSIEKILYDEILSVRSISETNAKKIENMLSVPDSRPTSQQQNSSQHSSDASSNSTTVKSPQQSQPPSSSDQDSLISDPSYSQLMRNVDTQAADESHTQATAGSNEPTDPATSSENESEAKQSSSKPPQMSNKATSPGLVGFGNSTSDRSCLKNKLQSDSDIRKPSQRPKQEKVKNINRDSISSDQSDNDDLSFTEVKTPR